jgi:hypothetical protein
MSRMRGRGSALLGSAAVSVFLLGLMVPVVGSSLAAPPSDGAAEVAQSVQHDVSRPLRDVPVSPSARNLTERPLRIAGINHGPASPDPVLQQSAPAAAVTTAGAGFAGVGAGDYGFIVGAAPPDTNLAVGTSQIVQWVNSSFMVFDKRGTVLRPPTAGNALWAGFGGACESNNDGDPIVQHDQLADRWIFTQFAVDATPYLQCVAVSTSPDALGTYNRYSFSYGTDFPDYPKLGVWPDAYYVTYNMFANGAAFEGVRTCAWDRQAMIDGTPAQQVCFQLAPAPTGPGGSILPADLDGTTLPPPGSPNYQLNLGASSLNILKFHVDFADPASSTISAPTKLPVAAFSTACNGGTCIPQPGTRQRLDSLGDRPMYRLAYRNLNGVQTLVVDHSVTAGLRTGVRWYELRVNGASTTVFQSGTFSPDSKYRWMGSIAMDRLGNIGLGYSVSSSTTFPSIAVTGRVPTDRAGTLRAETIVKAGGGAQLPNLSRWGDYSSLQLDPADDCTFWYTTEYLKGSGTFNWSTWITSFKMSGCT